MDIFLIILGFVLCIVGIIGAFLPIIPGPLTGWVGLLVLHFTSVAQLSYTFLGITLVVAIIIYVMDYLIPAIGTKRFGGSKGGVYGSMIGLVIGIIVPIPLGIIIGPFVGALIGELIVNADHKRAFKAAFGSFLGFLMGTFLKFLLACVYLGLYIWQVTKQVDWGQLT